MKKSVMGKGMLIVDRGNVGISWRRCVEGARMKSEEEGRCSVDKSGRRRRWCDEEKGKEIDESGEYIRQVWIMASRTSLLILMLVSVRRWFKMNWSLSALHLTTIVLMFCVVYLLW